MSLTVKIPPILRRITANRPTVEVQAHDVAGCLVAVEEQFPELKAQLRDDLGNIKPYFRINLNGKFVETGLIANIKVNDGDTVNLLIISGEMD